MRYPGSCWPLCAAALVTVSACGPSSDSGASRPTSAASRTLPTFTIIVENGTSQPLALVVSAESYSGPAGQAWFDLSGPPSGTTTIVQPNSRGEFGISFVPLAVTAGGDYAAATGAFVPGGGVSPSQGPKTLALGADYSSNDTGVVLRLP